MAIQWQPQEQDMKNILELLRQSTSPDTNIQRQVQDHLDKASKHPDFICYMIYVMSELRQETEPTRSLACIIAKNTVRSRYKQLPAHAVAMVKEQCLCCIGDSSSLIRATVGMLITTIVQQEGIDQWPELLPHLCQCIDAGASADAATVDGLNMCIGAFSALHKVCEDVPDQLDLHKTPDGQPLSAVLVPKILQFVAHPEPRVRTLALSCMNSFVMNHSPAMGANFAPYLEALFQLANDEQVDVKRLVCKNLVTMCESHLDIMLTQMSNIIQFMLHRTADTNEEVALEACEFWITLCDYHDICHEHLSAYVGDLVPILVKNMRYSELDVAVSAAADDDADVPDLDSDIRPRFWGRRLHSASTGSGMVSGLDGALDSGDMESTDDTEMDSGGGGGGFDDDMLNDWNLRKCSAASLDMLSNVFGNSILPVLLPAVNVLLGSDDWLEKESGILVLGAVAEGSYSGIEPHLGGLIPFLIQTLKDKKPLVRSITCWTLSRYSSWILQQPADVYLEPMLSELLGRVLDQNKKVQEAACSAFATIEEEAGDQLVPYLPRIISTLVEAFDKYQHRNLLILYDAIGTLADRVGTHLNRTEYIQSLMPPLLSRWMTLLDNDRDLFPLLECLSSVAPALQDGFLPYCLPVYTRCIRLIEQTLTQIAQHQASPATVPAPDKDFMIVALDMLSGLCEGLGAHIQPLVAESPLMRLLYECMQDPLAEVRQSCFAVVGDLTKAIWELVEPCVAEYMPLLCANLRPDQVSVCNNATWAIGEMAVRMGPAMLPYVGAVIEPLVSTIQKRHVPKTLFENTAITLGRLGAVNARQMAPHIGQFLQQWCAALRNVRDNDEKESAFRGMCEMIAANPTGVSNMLLFWCDAVASWNSPPPQLRSMFHSIFSEFRSQLYGHDRWQTFVQTQFPIPLRERLAAQYPDLFGCSQPLNGFVSSTSLPPAADADAAAAAAAAAAVIGGTGLVDGTGIIGGTNAVAAGTGGAGQADMATKAM